MIAFDNASQGGITANAVLTFALTVGVGLNRIVWVAFTANKASVPAISSVTFGGVPMTATADTPLAESSSLKMYLYFLVNPASGSSNAVITFASAPDEIHASAVSYSGAAQSGVPDAHATATGTGTSATITMTTTKANAWLVGLFRNDSSGNGSAGTGTTQRSSITGQNSFDDNNGLATTPGSYSIQETFGNALYGGIGAAMAPFVAPSGGAFFGAAAQQ